MCEECPGYPTECSVCGYDNHLLTSEICISCITATKHEQVRIITLLKHEYLEMEGLEYEHFSDTCITCDNIAFIKGEK